MCYRSLHSDRACAEPRQALNDPGNWLPLVMCAILCGVLLAVHGVASTRHKAADAAARVSHYCKHGTLDVVKSLLPVPAVPLPPVSAVGAGAEPGTALVCITAGAALGSDHADSGSGSGVSAGVLPSTGRRDAVLLSSVVVLHASDVGRHCGIPRQVVRQVGSLLVSSLRQRHVLSRNHLAGVWEGCPCCSCLRVHRCVCFVWVCVCVRCVCAVF